MVWKRHGGKDTVANSSVSTEGEAWDRVAKIASNKAVEKKQVLGSRAVTCYLSISLKQ